MSEQSRLSHLKAAVKPPEIVSKTASAPLRLSSKLGRFIGNVVVTTAAAVVAGVEATAETIDSRKEELRRGRKSK